MVIFDIQQDLRGIFEYFENSAYRPSFVSSVVAPGYL